MKSPTVQARDNCCADAPGLGKVRLISFAAPTVLVVMLLGISTSRPSGDNNLQRGRTILRPKMD